MNETRDLFSEPETIDARKLARASDPATSKAAAIRVDEFGEDLRSRIWMDLRRCGTGTSEEIALRMNLEHPQVWRRLSDLQKQGLARPVLGETRPGSTGRQQRVWEAIEQ